MSQQDEEAQSSSADVRRESALSSLKRLGGKNSISYFTKSIQRAASFREAQPTFREALQGIPSWPTLPGDGARPILSDEEAVGSDTEDERSADPGHGDEDADESTPLVKKTPKKTRTKGPLWGKMNDVARERVAEINRQREESMEQQKSSGSEPMLVKKMLRDDGTEAEVIVGQSTIQQTVFNASNVLIGVGMLSLPLGVRYTGWVIGLIFLVLSGCVTKYTAGLLATCLDVDRSLVNFGDIAYIAFGNVGKITTTTLFTLELVCASIALIILFADSLHSLVPELSLLFWKVICGVVLLPINFLPMRWLGFSSFLGLFCVLALLTVIIVDGCLKAESPGSLREPAYTSAWPQQWKAVPLSFGLIMAPWGGHSVFPNLYRDMKRPWKYERALYYTFTFTTGTDFLMAVIGLLMFGNVIEDEVTKNMLQLSAYPAASRIIILVLIAILPLTKFPLNVSPIVSTLEVVCGIDGRAATQSPNMVSRSKFLTRSLKAFFRIFVVVVIVLLAVLIPSFEAVLAVLGALFCFLIAIIMPVAFHLKMFGKELSKTRRIFDWSLIVLSAVLGLCGTAWEFLPRSWMGLE